LYNYYQYPLILMEIANALWHGGIHKNTNFQQLLWINKTNFWHPRFLNWNKKDFFSIVGILTTIRKC
jgi:hypothetical protein